MQRIASLNLNDDRDEAEFSRGYNQTRQTEAIVQSLKEYVAQRSAEAEQSEPARPAAAVAPSPIGTRSRAPFVPRKLSRAELDEHERQTYHPTPKVDREDDTGISYRVNKNWMFPYEHTHKQLVVLTQLFYDVAPLVLKKKMSTSVYVSNVLERIIVKDNSSTLIDLDTSTIDLYSSRQMLVLTSPGIGQKRNWVRQQVNHLRREHPGLARYSTAMQVEYLAQNFKRALCLRTVEARAAALKELPNSFRVDTRSKLGRPANWLGFPVNPPQGAVAYFRRQPHGAWVLWIQKGASRPQVSPPQSQAEDTSAY
jgi:hypothetical protein